jgi:Holliday junction resolvase RusA-like endonuclease
MGSLAIIEIEPNTKPRMTRADKWKKRPCVLQYRAFCDDLRLKTRGFQLSGSYKIIFYLSMPKSWSKKKRDLMRGQAHQKTPDLDNLLKAVNDALLEQDKIIFQIEASKWWADEGEIIIQNL